MAYSQDFRLMILAKLKEGVSFRKLADEYQLSTHTIQRWKKNPERKKRLFKPLKIDNELLKADIQAYPDDYQWERAQRFGCSQKSISRALKRIGITLEKDLKASTE